MGAILEMTQAGFTFELLPNNKLGVRPNKLTQQQRTLIQTNKAEIIQYLQIEAVRAWLYKIEEPGEYHHIVLDKCKHDPEALAYFLKHANGEFEVKDLLDKN